MGKLWSALRSTRDRREFRDVRFVPSPPPERQSAVEARLSERIAELHESPEALELFLADVRRRSLERQSERNVVTENAAPSAAQARRPEAVRRRRANAVRERRQRHAQARKTAARLRRLREKATYNKVFEKELRSLNRPRQRVWLGVLALARVVIAQRRALEAFRALRAEYSKYLPQVVMLQTHFRMALARRYRSRVAAARRTLEGCIARYVLRWRLARLRLQAVDLAVRFLREPKLFVFLQRFRFKVLRAQRCAHAFIACRRARLRALELWWARLETRMDLPAPVPTFYQYSTVDSLLRQRRQGHVRRIVVLPPPPAASDEQPAAGAGGPESPRSQARRFAVAKGLTPHEQIEIAAHAAAAQRPESRSSAGSALSFVDEAPFFRIYSVLTDAVVQQRIDKCVELCKERGEWSSSD